MLSRLAGEAVAYPANMDVHSACPTRVLISPSPFEQRLARENASAVLCQKTEQLEFLMREDDDAGAQPDLVPGGVDH